MVRTTVRLESANLFRCPRSSYDEAASSPAVMGLQHHYLFFDNINFTFGNAFKTDTYIIKPLNFLPNYSKQLKKQIDAQSKTNWTYGRVMAKLKLIVKGCLQIEGKRQWACVLKVSPT